MSHQCQYCDKRFTRAYNLKYHQTHTKACLEKQQAVEYKCEYCASAFTRKDSLKKHQTRCASAHEQRTAAMEDRIVRKVAEQVQEILNQGGQRSAAQSVKEASQIQIIGNMNPLNVDTIKSNAIEFFTLDEIKKGLEGLMAFVSKYPIQFVVTDKSRKKIKYKDQDGSIVDDMGGMKLSQRFFGAINDHNQKKVREAYAEMQEAIQDIANRGATGDEDIVSLIQKALNLQSFGQQCGEITAGVDNDLRKTFINRLIKMS